MARKITVLRTNTMQEMMQKVGQMADFTENLDDLGGTYDSIDPINGNIHDSSIISAINFSATLGDDILNTLFQDTKPPPTIITANIQSDSGSIDKLVTNTLNASDQFMPGPRIGDHGSLWVGDQRGTAGVDFDCDSAYIKKLKIPSFLDVSDSAQIYEKIVLGALVSDSGDDQGVVIDSATVTHAFINTLHMDGVSVSQANPFIIKDANGTVLFAAHQLNT
tara:strand:- start:292 stop:954 length:663 start_codon:yes stop_codon:yes gene_type:complete